MKILLLVMISLVVVANKGVVWAANTTATNLTTVEIVTPNATEQQNTSALLTTVISSKLVLPTTSTPVVAPVQSFKSIKVSPVMLNIQPLNIKANKPLATAPLKVRVNYSLITPAAATIVEYSTKGNDLASVIAQRMIDNPGLNGAIDAILVIVALQTMLGLGCTMDFQMVIEHMKNPIGVGVAVACQFGIMPFVAFIMAKMFGLGKVGALAVLVTGSCPGGNLSNLLTFFLYGDMNLSVLISSASTLLSLVFMPICMLLYGSNWIALSEIGQIVPFGGIILSFLLTIIPVVCGMLIRRWSEPVANTILKISLLSVAISVISIMTFSGMLLGSYLFTALPAKMYAIAFIMPLIGYASGYLMAIGFRLPDASRRTVGIETGCQNSQLSAAILKIAFSTKIMGGYFLFPVYYVVFQASQGALFVLLFRIYRKRYADDTLAPLSRVTYDKFDSDDGIDRTGEDFRVRTTSDYGNLPGDITEDYHNIGRTTGYQISTDQPNYFNANHENGQVLAPSDLPVTSTYSLSPEERERITGHQRQISLPNNDYSRKKEQRKHQHEDYLISPP